MMKLSDALKNARPMFVSLMFVTYTLTHLVELRLLTECFILVGSAIFGATFNLLDNHNF